MSKQGDQESKGIHFTGEGHLLAAMIQDFDLLEVKRMPAPERAQVYTSLYRSHYSVAKIFYDKSDLLQAQKHFLSCLEIFSCQKDGDILQTFKVLGFLVRLASEMLDPLSAQKYTGLSEELLIKMKKSGGITRSEISYNEGIVATYRGRFGEAQEAFSRAYKESQQDLDAELSAKSLHALAMNAVQTKDYLQADKVLSQLSSTLQTVERSYLAGSMHLLRGNVSLELGHFDKALDSYRLAKRSLMLKTCWNLFPYLLLGEGMTYKKMGELSKALFFLEYALDSIDQRIFRRATTLLQSEVLEINDSSVDLYLDKQKRVVIEKHKGVIDFKHRFILLEILFLLAQNPGVTFDKEGLAKNIWQHEYNPLIHDKLIYTSVSRLRKLLEPREEKRLYIIRVKDGYIFNPQVKVRFQKENEFGLYRPSIANIELSSPI